LLCGAACACAGEAGWRPLFNGRDLSGWETYLAKPPKHVQVEGLSRDAQGEYTEALGVNRDPLKTFTVVEVDGEPALHIDGEVAGGIATLDTYSNYHLRLQFKWGRLREGQKPGALRNSGLLYDAHGEHGAGNGRWLPSHQFQIQNGFVGDYVAMGPCGAFIHSAKADAKKFVYEPGAEERAFSNTAPDPTRCTRRDAKENADGEWNTLDLYCVGDTAVHVVNGRAVLLARSVVRAADAAWAPLVAGRFELQAEGWDIYFRRIEICPISEIPAEVSKSL
jgi:hypothetical protein